MTRCKSCKGAGWGVTNPCKKQVGSGFAESYPRGMANRAKWAWLLALSVGTAAALANCSSEDEGPPPSGAGGKKSTTTTKTACKSPKSMTVSGLTASTTLPGTLEGKAKGSDGKEWTIRIELSDREDAKNAPGVYDLAEQPTYDGCRQCVVAFQGDELLGAEKQLFQTGGTLKLDTVSSPPTGVSKGELQKVELREVTIDAESAEVVEVSGGVCYNITSFEWDTTPDPDQKCQKAEDCGDPQSVACDPKTGQCVAFQCEIETNKGCADSELCLAQEIGASYGACYPTCTPFYPEDSCPSGRECVPLDAEQTRGKCLPPGASAGGSSCTPGLLETGCAAGLLCVGPEGEQVCRKTCDFFDDTVTCSGGDRCVFGGYCTSEAGESAAIDAACSGSAFEGAPCGLDGSTYRGLCTAEEGGLKCRQACRSGSVFEDCPEGMVCAVGAGETALPSCQPKKLDEEVTP